jgi:chorismate mutase
VDWRRRRREIRLAQIRRHVLEVTVSVGRAIEPRVGEMRRIAAVLAARGGGIARPARTAKMKASVLVLRRIESLPAGRSVVHRAVQAIHRTKAARAVPRPAVS